MRKDDGFDLFGKWFDAAYRLAAAGAVVVLLALAAGTVVACVAAWRYVMGG